MVFEDTSLDGVFSTFQLVTCSIPYTLKICWKILNGERILYFTSNHKVEIYIAHLSYSDEDFTFIKLNFEK